MTAPRTAADLTALARWSIVGLLAAVLFINYVDRGAVPTAAHLIQDELRLSATQLGLLFSAFSFSYAPLQIPIGWLAERIGAQRVLAAGLVVWACATMLSGFAHSFAELLALRLLLGVGESAGFPCVSKLLAVVVPVSSLGIANGIVAVGYLFGPAVGSFGGGLLMTHFGWRATFWVFGALSLVWLLPWSRVRLPRGGPVASSSDGPTLAAVLRQRSLWGTALGLFSSNYTFYFMLNWLPSYLVRERGYSTLEMSTLTGWAFVVTALSALVAGWAIDRLGRSGHTNLAYKSVMVVAHLGTVACMLLIGLGTLPWAIAGIFAFQVLNGAASPGVFAISQVLAGPTASARWVGIQNCCGNVAGMIAPALTGLIADQTHHLTAAFVVAAAVSVVGVYGWVWMVPRVAPLAWQPASAKLAT